MIPLSLLLEPAVLILLPLTIGILAQLTDFFDPLFEGLYKLVVILILPALVFGAVAVQRPAGILSLGGITTLALIGLGATSIASVLGTRLLGMGREQSTEIFINATFMNYTFLGLAVVQSIIGTNGLAHASIYAVTVGILHLTIGMVLTKSSAGKKVKPTEILHDILSFPAAFALIIALSFVALKAGVPYWELARSGMDNYANLASFLMVLAAGYKIKISHLKKYLSAILGIGFIRLFLCPLVTYIAIEVFLIPWNIGRVALILSIMPPGVFNIILAERFDLNREAYGSIVFYLTLISLFVALPLLLHFTFPSFSLI